MSDKENIQPKDQKIVNYNLVTDSHEQHTNIIFCNESFDWIIEINSEGIKFNVESFSHFEPEDYVREFIKILENNFSLKFIEKNNEITGE